MTRHHLHVLEICCWLVHVRIIVYPYLCLLSYSSSWILLFLFFFFFCETFLISLHQKLSGIFNIFFLSGIFCLQGKYASMSIYCWNKPLEFLNLGLIHAHQLVHCPDWSLHELIKLLIVIWCHCHSIFKDVIRDICEEVRFNKVVDDVSTYFTILFQHPLYEVYHAVGHIPINNCIIDLIQDSSFDIDQRSDKVSVILNIHHCLHISVKEFVHILFLYLRLIDLLSFFYLFVRFRV